MIELECRIAAAGYGSRLEQRDWTCGEWAAVVELLPSLEALDKLRQGEVLLAPHLWRHAHEAYVSLVESWRAIAAAAREPSGEPRGPRYLPRDVVSLKGLKSWMQKLFGAQIRSE